jgi:hypothetical protein
MTSVERSTSQIPANKLYVNIGAVHSTIYTDTGVRIPWVIGRTDLQTPGAAIFRDMGKTVYLGQSESGAAQSTILRKVQLVPSGASGYYGTGDDGSGEYYTGYISLGGQTYGGGTGVCTAVARLN